MKTSYQPLCKLQLEHSYYDETRDAGNFRIHPTPACQRILDHHHILFRQTENGVLLYVAVIPDTKPPELFQELNLETLKLAFWLEVINPLFFNISALPAEHNVGKELFYFNNLTDHRPSHADGEPLYLNDTTSKQSLGASLELLTGSLYTASFKQKVTDITLNLKDQFENILKSIPINEPNGLSEYRIDLADISGLIPGQYLLENENTPDDSYHIYYDPELRGKSIFGLIELYNTTTNLTPDSSEKVISSYQFLSSDNKLTPLSAYILRLNNRETIWRYIVTMKYQDTGLDLSKLSIKYDSGAPTFAKTLKDKQIIFTSEEALPLKETPPSVSLLLDGEDYMSLPIPTSSTALQKPSELNDLSSDMYIYI